MYWYSLYDTAYVPCTQGQLYLTLNTSRFMRMYLSTAQASRVWWQELGERLKGLLRPILLHKCNLQERAWTGADDLSVRTARFILVKTIFHCWRATRTGSNIPEIVSHIK